MKTIRLIIIQYLILTSIYRGDIALVEILGALVILVGMEAFLFIRTKRKLNLILLAASGTLLFTVCISSIFNEEIKQAAYLIGFGILMPCIFTYLATSLIDTFTKNERSDPVVVRQ